MTSLKTTSDGGFQLTDKKDYGDVTAAWCTYSGSHTFYDASFLVQMVSSAISSYPLGSDNIAFIAFTEPLNSYLAVAQPKLSPFTSLSQVSLITLLKLTTFRLVAQDRRSLAYLGHVVTKNGITIAHYTKPETLQFSESHTFMDRLDILVLPINMEAFGICVRGLTSAIHLLVHPSAITTTELMELFWQLTAFYEL